MVSGAAGAMTQWEYLYLVADRDEVFKINDRIVERSPLPSYLDKLGWDGWEMIGISPESSGYWRMVFKRARKPEAIPGEA